MVKNALDSGLGKSYADLINDLGDKFKVPGLNGKAKKRKKRRSKK